ncbi:MAG: hypothetical protein ACKPKO_05235, partial [Candidatus Fonsibacter sp.]
PTSDAVSVGTSRILVVSIGRKLSTVVNYGPAFPPGGGAIPLSGIGGGTISCTEALTALSDVGKAVDSL